MTARTVSAHDPSPELQSILLRDVSWKTYELLLRDLQEEHVFLTYDNGLLEIDRRGEVVGALEPISWKTYESLLRDIGDGNTRLTYNSGRLWIVSPLPRHERINKLIGGMIQLMALELRVPISSFGSTTWRSLKTMKGLDADECYYVQSEPQVRGKDDIDLELHPPPDLVVEVEISRPMTQDRLAILAALGVPEVWHHRKEHLRALKLNRGKYAPITTSLAFPMLRPGDLDRFLKMRHSTDETTLMVSFQEWVRSLRPST